MSSISSSECLSSLHISEKEILIKLQGLDVSKGAGADDIPPIFILSCASRLCKPLYFIYNKSLQSGIFPEKWKIAKVVPVYKSGISEEVQNYRPISILSTFSKIFESLVSPHIQNYFRPFLSKHQHGFIKARSTTTNLVTYYEMLIEGMEGQGQVDVIYTDFSNAFDSISHSILLEKLRAYGFSHSLLLWIKSYLNNRSFDVVSGGYESDTFNILSSVPQGSILGPVLFGIFVNDLPYCLRSSTLYLFADDLKFSKVIKSQADVHLLQDDIDRLVHWCDENDMKLNAKKCSSISFSRKRKITDSFYTVLGVLLPKVEEIRDLGVIFDNKMTFIPQIENVVKRASRMLGFVLRNAKI